VVHGLFGAFERGFVIRRREANLGGCAGVQNRPLDQRRVLSQAGQDVGFAALARVGVEVTPGTAALVDHAGGAVAVDPLLQAAAVDAVVTQVDVLIIDAGRIQPAPGLAAGVAGLDAIKLDHGKFLGLKIVYSTLRSSSLVLTLARVAASTVLTMMALLRL